MSYARFGIDSDVYVFAHHKGGVECCGCRLSDGSVRFETSGQTIKHLGEHYIAGHRIPFYVIPDIVKDYPNLDEIIEGEQE